MRILSHKGIRNFLEGACGVDADKVQSFTIHWDRWESKGPEFQVEVLMEPNIKNISIEISKTVVDQEET